MILNRLGNIVTKKDRKDIKKSFIIQKKIENISDKVKEEIYDYLVNLVKTLDNKEKYYDGNDLDQFGITNIENLCNNVDNNNYYKPILVKSSFNSNYKYYESRGDKDKKLSIKEYLYRIMSYLGDLINDHKTNENNSSKWKIQINIQITFISLNDTRETRTIYVWSDNEEIRLGNETDDIIKKRFESF